MLVMNLAQTQKQQRKRETRTGAKPFLISETFTEFTDDVGWVKGFVLIKLRQPWYRSLTAREEQPRMLTGFTAALLLITVSELGDKTFFVSAILAMRHPRRWVFLGAVLALAAMTILSVMLGQFANLLPQSYVHWGEVLLFLCFGLKLLYDARHMSPNACLAEEQEAAETVMEAEMKIKPRRSLGVVYQAFGLTFIGEWGDRTQITTIALAAANNPVGVSLGAIIGHAFCALIAVQCGKFFCGRISEQKLTAIGGSLFLLFGSISFARLMGWLG